MQYSEIKPYTEYLFRIAMQKCGNLHDAEDLTQDVLLAALSYTKKVENVKSWLSAVLNNMHNDMLRKKYKLPMISIDLIPEEAEPIENNQYDDRPNGQQVRREVAYLSGKYREIIVHYYLYGEKVESIAAKFGIPKGTVLSRLSYGREQMKKGFDSMENYEKQSYQPERLDIGCHGYPGFHDEPQSLVSDDLMKQNILIIAYKEPLTSVEIAKALGIPTAYIEKALDDLVSSELMRMIGNKYVSDFMIITPDDLLRCLDVEIELTNKHYDKLLQLVKDYLNELRNADFIVDYSDGKRKRLEYYFILHLFSSGIYTATQRIFPSKEEYPSRPDGGRWFAVGNRYPTDFDFENYRFSKYCYGGERRAYWENTLGARSIDLHIYDTQPDLNKYNRGPKGITDGDLAKLLYIIQTEIPFESTGFDAMLLESVPHLIQCGILLKNNEKLCVAIPIMRSCEYIMVDKIRIKYMLKLADLLEPILREHFPEMKIEIPKHLQGRVAKFRQYSCYEIPMAFMKMAIENGDFDSKNATPPMVLVVEDNNKKFR